MTSNILIIRLHTENYLKRSHTLMIFIYFLSGHRFFMAIKVSITSSSLTLEKASRSMNVTRQSSKTLSPILFLNLFFTKLIAENALSTLAVATGRINTSLSSKYTRLWTRCFLVWTSLTEISASFLGHWSYHLFSCHKYSYQVVCFILI